MHTKTPPNSSQLSYPFEDSMPGKGAILAVAPGIFWIRMGLPFALDHINLWLLEESQETGATGWTIIDCGIANDSTRADWEKIFTTALKGLPVVRVIATHSHPDHIGLASWLCDRWHAPLWMSCGEYFAARILCSDTIDSMTPHFRRHGFDHTNQIVSSRQSYYKEMVPTIPLSYHRLVDQQKIRIGMHDWQVITGTGHTPEHVALYCATRQLLISGDMVLPRISTNVSVWPIEPEANPVREYLDSLEKFYPLPNNTLVLPSHGKPFFGLQTRINQLTMHHTERLENVMQACSATPRCAAEILPILFPRVLDAHQMMFAFGETLAHLHKLWIDGVLQRDLGTDQVYRFIRKPE